MSAEVKAWNAEEIKTELLEMLEQWKKKPAEKLLDEVYEVVKIMLAEGYPLKHVLDKLAARGLKISPATFKKFLKKRGDEPKKNAKRKVKAKAETKQRVPRSKKSLLSEAVLPAAATSAGEAE